LCQSGDGRNRTRVERLVTAPSPEACRMIFLRLFFGKLIGTIEKTYKLAPVKQKLSHR